MLREMLLKNPTQRSSSYQILTKYRNKFDDHSDNAQNPTVKYSPVKTMSRIDITVENSRNEQKSDPRQRKYSPDFNMSNRNQIK